MVNWPAILEVGIYPIAALFPLLDGLSTVILLKYEDDTIEANVLPRWLHNRFGVIKGQTILAGVSLPVWLLLVYLGKEYADITITLFLVGVLVGFSIRQSITAWDAYQSK